MCMPIYEILAKLNAQMEIYFTFGSVKGFFSDWDTHGTKIKNAFYCQKTWQFTKRLNTCEHIWSSKDQGLSLKEIICIDLL